MNQFPLSGTWFAVSKSDGVTLELLVILEGATTEEALRRLSAKAAQSDRPDGQPMTEAEIEAAEEEAEAWARRVNSC